MKRLILMAALAAATLGGASFAATPSGFDSGVYSPKTDAPALQQVAYRHYCIAHSRVAYGYGYSPYLASAKTIALANCSVRTPRGLLCIITSCT
jgi:hypothetical protein